MQKSKAGGVKGRSSRHLQLKTSGKKREEKRRGGVVAERFEDPELYQKHEKWFHNPRRPLSDIKRW